MNISDALKAYGHVDSSSGKRGDSIINKSVYKAELPEKMELNIPGVKMLKGDKGERGLKGEKGERGERGMQGEKGDKPIKGVDYFTKRDVEEIASKAKPVRGKDYFTERELDVIRRDIYEQLQSNDIPLLKDQISELTSPSQIRDALTTLEGDKRLDASAIKNLDKHLKTVTNIVGGGNASSFAELNDVDSDLAGNADKGVKVNAEGTALEFFTIQEGDINEVVAGTGLSGGGTTGSVTVTLDQSHTDSLYLNQTSNLRS